jgi:hypothetical protein
MTWLLVALAWTLLASAVAGLAGRGIRLADESDAPAPWVDEVDAFLRRHAADTGAQPGPAPQLPRP